ncbi:MAG: NACHT domain-containing protein [Candidatus Cloacimonetes bacterium]|nr:NACHT domain-containing protein [Candidatus Cloacimonadota bacterium]
MQKLETMDDSNFELEVINVARNLWPSDESGGSQIIDDRERDGIFITEDAVHLIECTVSRTKEKAIKDTGKLSSLLIKMRKRYQDKAIKAWFITRDEPTADQRSVALKHDGIAIMSYEKFRSKIIDVSTYKQCRQNYPFGSLRDPLTGNPIFKGKYISVEFVDIKKLNNIFSIEKICDSILNGERYVIQGHYGVGKSMALYEIYKILMSNYEQKLTYKFPIYLNLRDHHGQINPVEAIERHARNIGFSNHDHLVRAWRAGYVILLLDGFDEIAAFGWAGKSRTLKDIRYRSMELLREFSKQHPSNIGLVIVGRINYFDSIKESENALHTGVPKTYIKISDFTTGQAEEYLKNNNIVVPLPSWIPTRPLLLGYLVAKGILKDVINYSGVDVPSEGWIYLVDEICKRESSIEAGLTPDSIKDIIEGIASYCRLFQSGMGPVYQIDLERIFTEKCGYPPDERALVILQRLPGLGAPDQQDGARYLIDYYFAAVAKAGEIASFVSNPYDYKITGECRKWQESLDDIGIQALSYKITEINHGLIEDALIQAKRNSADCLAIDILMSLNYLGLSWKRENVVFKDVLIPYFELKKDVDLCRITFNEVLFKELIIEELPEYKYSPNFNLCLIGKLIGSSPNSTIVNTLLYNSTIDNYEEQETTTSALMNLDLPVSTKVGLTILKKLYVQTGHGRQENAFYRGLSTNEQTYVQPILELFKNNQITISSKQNGSNKVWQPIKYQYGRVRNILINRAFNDPIIDMLNIL